MSLFQLRECWSSGAVGRHGGDGQSEDERLDPCGPGCAAVGKLLPPSEADDREQVVLAGLDGTLYIYDPGQTLSDQNNLDADENNGISSIDASYRPDHLLLEQHMGSPVLQVCIGRFTTAQDRQSVAVLQPRRLAVFALSCTRAAGAPAAQSAEYQLHQAYEHRLPRAAYNMAMGPFGGATDRDHLCIQSLDGQLSVFERETHTFSRFVPGALLPGPVAYVGGSDAFVIGTAAGFIEAYGYQTLASASEDSQQTSPLTPEDPTLMSSTSSSGKRVTTDWTFELGMPSLAIAVVEMSPAQPSIVVLAERALFCLTEGASDGFIQYMVASESGTLLLYADTTLRWTVRLPFAPIHLLRLTFGSLYRGLLAAVAPSGTLTIGYLGTEPALYTLPHTDTRHIDYDARLKELRQLQHAIRANSNQHVSRTSFPHLAMSRTQNAYDTRIADGRAPSITVTVRIACKQPVADAQLYVRAPPPLHAHQQAFYWAQIGTEGTELPVTVFAQDTTAATGWTALVTLVFKNAAGVLHSTHARFTLPLNLLYTVVTTSGSRAAAHKVTLETGCQPMGLEQGLGVPQLFAEMLPSDSGLDGPCLTLTVQQIGAELPPVTLMASKNTQRYRVQSDAIECIGPVLSALVRKLQSGSATLENGQKMKLSFNEELPLPAYFSIVDSHFELQKRQFKLAEVLEQRCSQLTAIQRRLMMRFKDAAAGDTAKQSDSMVHMDTLFELTQRQVLSVASAQHELMSHVQSRSAAVESTTRLLLQLVALKHDLSELDRDLLEATLCPIVDEYPEQTWQQRVDAGASYLSTTLSKGHSSVAPTIGQLPKVQDTTRFKKHVALLFEKVAKFGGLGSLAAPTTEKPKTKDKPVAQPIKQPARTQPIAFRAPLEPIAEDSAAGDEATEPAVSSFAAILPVAGGAFAQQSVDTEIREGNTVDENTHPADETTENNQNEYHEPKPVEQQNGTNDLHESMLTHEQPNLDEQSLSGNQPEKQQRVKTMESLREQGPEMNDHENHDHDDDTTSNQQENVQNDIIEGLERPMSTAHDRSSDSDEGF